MEKKLDLRVRKTRKALTNSLLELLREKSFDEITVTELCNRAMVRKATFYNHFSDKTELLVYLIREMQQEAIEENAIGYDPAIPASYYVGAFRYLMNFIAGNEALVVSVLRSNAGNTVRNILEEQIRLNIDEHLRQEKTESIRESHEMLSVIYAGSIVSCAAWWALKDERPDKEEMIRKFARLLIGALP